MRRPSVLPCVLSNTACIANPVDDGVGDCEEVCDRVRLIVNDGVDVAEGDERCEGVDVAVGFCEGVTLLVACCEDVTDAVGEGSVPLVCDCDGDSVFVPACEAVLLWLAICDGVCVSVGELDRVGRCDGDCEGVHVAVHAVFTARRRMAPLKKGEKACHPAVLLWLL